MKRQSLYNIITGRIVEKADKYQFFKDDSDDEPVEIDAADEDEAMDKIEKITKKDPKKVTFWRKTKPGEKSNVTEADEDDDFLDATPFDQDEWDAQFADDGDAQTEPDDEDIVISDCGQLGSKTCVSIVGGRSLGTFDEWDDAIEAIKMWSKKNKFWPTVWYMSDHGNYRVVKDVYESVTEENTTSNLDGGLGQPRTPMAFQHTRPTRADKRKEYRNSTSSSGYSKYTQPSSCGECKRKLESYRGRIGKVISESMVVGIGAVGVMRELKARTTPEKHQEQIALKTLKMTPAMAAVMGGMSVDEAVKFLKRIGYTAQEINKLAGETITEAKYSDWANDTTSTPKEKINKSIQEVNRKLYEIETMVNRVMKLKIESGLDQGAYWKQTLGRFNKISERLLRVSTKLRELNK